jgi:hypothetical protein
MRYGAAVSPSRRSSEMTSTARGVFLVGPYGSGKSTVAIEMCNIIEDRDWAYALIDLDYLAWANPPTHDEHKEPRLLLGNLEAVVRNYRNAGIEYFVVAGYVPDGDTLDAISAVLDVAITVVRLEVASEEITRRLRSGIDSWRLDGSDGAAHDAAAFEPTDSVVIRNDDAPHVTAQDVLHAIGWL